MRLARKAVRTAQMKVNTGSYDPLGTLSTLTYSTVQLKNFRMEKAVTYPMRKDLSLVQCEELEPILLDGDVPQRVVSADGYDVLYRIPGAFQGKSLVSPFTSFSSHGALRVNRIMSRVFAKTGAMWRKSRRPWPTIRRVIISRCQGNWLVPPDCARCGMR